MAADKEVVKTYLYQIVWDLREWSSWVRGIQAEEKPFFILKLHHNSYQVAAIYVSLEIQLSSSL